MPRPRQPRCVKHTAVFCSGLGRLDFAACNFAAECVFVGSGTQRYQSRFSSAARPAPSGRCHVHCWTLATTQCRSVHPCNAARWVQRCVRLKFMVQGGTLVAMRALLSRLANALRFVFVCLGPLWTMHKPGPTMLQRLVKLASAAAQQLQDLLESPAQNSTALAAACDRTIFAPPPADAFDVTLNLKSNTDLLRELAYVPSPT